VVSFTPRPLYPQGKRPWYQFDRRLGGPQSRSGRGDGEKNSQPPPGIELSSKISNKLYSAVRLMNFISTVFSLLISLCSSVRISQPYRIDGRSKIYTFSGDCFRTKFGIYLAI
jgi:hypothetical protein